MNIKNTLTRDDLQKWGQELIRFFVVPVALAFLTALQVKDFQFALGAAYATGLACAISLLGKYSSGVDASLLKPEATKPIFPAVEKPIVTVIEPAQVTPEPVVEPVVAPTTEVVA